MAKQKEQEDKEVEVVIENEVDFQKLLTQVKEEYDLSFNYINQKWEEWGKRLKIYNNQKRNKENVGHTLMFSIHQTILASLNERIEEWKKKHMRVY